MVQINTESQTRRHVRRVIPSGRAALRPDQSPVDVERLDRGGEGGDTWNLGRMAMEAMFQDEAMLDDPHTMRMLREAGHEGGLHDDDDDADEHDDDDQEDDMEDHIHDIPAPTADDTPEEEDEDLEEDEEEEDEEDELAMALAMSLAEAESIAHGGAAEEHADPSADLEAASEPAAEPATPTEEATPEAVEPQPSEVEAAAQPDAERSSSEAPSKDVVEDGGFRQMSEPPEAKPPPQPQDGHMWIAVVGPHNSRKVALALIEREREVREVMMRVLPSMQGCISPEEVMARTGCRVVSHEGPGMVRLVGYPGEIKKARAALIKLMPMWQRAVQKRRLEKVTKDLVSELSKIEVRVPISDRMRQLLSQPISMHASSHLKKSHSLFDKYRRSERRQDQPDIGRVQVMWVSLDEFAAEITKKLNKHGVPVPKEWTAQGGSVGLYIGDTVRCNASFSATPAALKAVENCNAPASEVGKVLKIESWLNLDVEAQRTTLDVFLRTVEDWLKCTCEQRVSDPGRPSLVTIEVEWEVSVDNEVKGHHGMWRQDGLTVNQYATHHTLSSQHHPPHTTATGAAVPCTVTGPSASTSGTSAPPTGRAAASAT